MKRTRGSLMIVVLVIILSITTYKQLSFAQEKISSSQLENLQEQLNYDKTKKALVPRQFDKEEKKDKYNREKDNDQLRGNGENLNVIGYTIGGLLLLVLLYFIIRSISLSRSKTEEDSVDLENIETIDDHDFKSLLNQKLEEKDYRAAIRIHFLTILQLMSKQGLIEWKKNKTNLQYAKECRDMEVKGKFKKIAYAYDILWYGNEEISVEKYQYIAHKADELSTFLSQKALV